MAIKVKKGGVYTDPVGIFAKKAGVYSAVAGVFAKSSGVYTRVDAFLTSKILAMFASRGGRGTWQDRSDSLTIFQDNTGTTPTTAAGQTLGMQLDKKDGTGTGPKYGLELAGPSAVWTLGNGASEVDDLLVFSSGTIVSAYLPGIVTNLKYYKIEFEIVSISAGNVRIGVGAALGTGTTLSTVAGKKIAHLRAGSTGTVEILSSAGATFSIRKSSFSIMEATGNHATQTTVGLRPTYQVSPPRAVFDGVDDVMLTPFPVALGAGCTVARSIPGVGAQILTNQTLTSAFSDNVSSNALLIFPAPALTAGETSDLTTYLNQLDSGNPLFRQTIAFLGDSLMELETYPEQVAAKAGFLLLKAGIGGTRMAAHSDPGYDGLGGYKIAQAIGSGNYTALQAANAALIAAFADDNTVQVNRIVNADWSQVYAAIFGEMTNDFAANRPLGLVTDVHADGSTFCGAVNYIIQTLRLSHPALKLAFISAPWRGRTPTDPDGLVYGGSDATPNNLGLYLIQYVDALKSVCAAAGVPCLDWYRTSGVGPATDAVDLVDKLHFSPTGATKVVPGVVSFIKATLT